MENHRKINASRAYLEGLIELQDAHSQAVINALPEVSGNILDYCAGGGGKTLAMAAHFGRRIDAHDGNPRRMRDLPVRASRAGADVRIVPEPEHCNYDLVLCDVPCSGSGSWRRDPQGKWSLTADELVRIRNQQHTILSQARACLKPGGLLAYVTCSVLACENEDQVAEFLSRNPEFNVDTHRWLPGNDGDGFFLATFRD